MYTPPNFNHYQLKANPDLPTPLAHSTSNLKFWKQIPDIKSFHPQIFQYISPKDGVFFVVLSFYTSPFVVQDVLSGRNSFFLRKYNQNNIITLKNKH